MSEIDYLKDTMNQDSDTTALITQSVDKLVQKAAEAAKLEKLLTDLKAEISLIETEEIPGLMEQVGLKEFVTSQGLKVTIQNVISGSIPSYSSINRMKDQEQREFELSRMEQCFDWLESNGYDSIIKSQLSVKFGKGEKEWMQKVKQTLINSGVDPVEDVSVHPSTLNSWLKEKISQGDDIPFDLFKVYTGTKAKIKTTIK